MKKKFYILSHEPKFEHLVRIGVRAYADLYEKRLEISIGEEAKE